MVPDKFESFETAGMGDSNINNSNPSIGDVLKENRILKRKLAFAELVIFRAQQVNDAKHRVEAAITAELTREQQFFQLILENTNHLMLLLDYDGRFAYASSSFLKIIDVKNFGLINGLHYKEVLEDYISADLLSLFISSVDDAVQTRKPVFFEELINFTSTGVQKDFYVSVIPMISEAGKDSGILLLLNDISEIKYQGNMLSTINKVSALLLDPNVETFDAHLHEALGFLAVASEVDRAYVMKNHTVDGVRFHTQICEWSERVRPLQNSAEVTNLRYDELLPGLEDMLQNGDNLNVMVKELPQNTLEYLEKQDIKSILVVPIFLKNVFWGTIGFDDCVNERYFTHYECLLLRSAGSVIANALLRQEMLQNLHETSVKLEAALVEANAASKAKGDFLSNMSHEMRTPLNVIIGMSAIGKKVDDIQEMSAVLEKIEDASSHLLSLVNNVLDMAKIEADKIELTLAEFNFKDTLEKAADIIKHTIEEKEQKYSMNIDARIPPLLVGDSHRLTQVVTNLLSNAVKFTHNGGEICLSASPVDIDDANCTLCVEIADNGIGISKEQQKKLFMAFSQAESGTSREFGGTGLGLVISKRIVELMGGKIWVESELGEGARFSFQVVLGRGSESPETQAGKGSESNSSIRAAVAPQGGPYKGKRLLLVEDIAINREILLSLLAESDLTIDCAENGQVAMEMIRDNPDKYDIVFMDVQMPKMDGREATRQIRALPDVRTSKLPIIAMTAYAFKSDIEECLEAGMDDYITKPIDINLVYEKLREYLGRS